MPATVIRSRDKFGMSAEMSAVLRGLAQGNAINAFSRVTSPAFTDNSTGTNGAATKSLSLPSAPFDANANVSALSATVTGRGTAGSYVPGVDVLTLTGDTGPTEPAFPVTKTELRTAAVATSGTGADATGVTFTGTTGTGTKFTVTGDISTNTLSNIAIVTRGDYSVNPTDLANEPITATGYTGYELLITMGVKTVAPPSVAGSLTVIGGEPHSTSNSGSASGATLTVLWAAGVSKTNFDNAVTKADNALSVMCETLGDYFALLSLPEPTYEGTVATPDTIPAMDKTFAALTPGSASTAIDYTTGVAALARLRNSMATVVRGYNMLRVAVGQTAVADATGGSPSGSALPSPLSPPFGAPSNAQAGPDAVLAITTPEATVAGTGTVAGDTSISQATLNTFFTNLADTIAFIAASLNTLRTALNAGTLPQLVVTVD